MKITEKKHPSPVRMITKTRQSPILSALPVHTVGVNLVIPILIFDLILFYPITLFVGFGVNLTVSRPLSLFIPRSHSLPLSLARLRA